MNFSVIILSLLVSCSYAIEDVLKQNRTSNNLQKQREPRQYNSLFYPELFGDEADSSDEYNTHHRSNTISLTDNHGFYKQKKFAAYPGQGFFPNYNGLKKLQADQSGAVMLMTNDLDQRQSSGEDKGLLSNLNPQLATVMAAAIPLAIILFAVLPALINFFQAGPSSVLGNLPVTTIANSRLGRALVDKEYLEDRLQEVLDFAVKALQRDECLEQTVCRTVVGNAGRKHARAVAAAVDFFGSEDWVEGMGAGGLKRALAKGDCERVCDATKKV